MTDFEWCGPMAMSFVSRKVMETQGQCVELASRCKFLENSLSNELVVVANLRNKLKQTQSQSTDNEWRLQEQIAQLNILLCKERNKVEELEKDLGLSKAQQIFQPKKDQLEAFKVYEDQISTAESARLPAAREGSINSFSGKDVKSISIGKENDLGIFPVKKKSILGRKDSNNMIRNILPLDL